LAQFAIAIAIGSHWQFIGIELAQIFHIVFVELLGSIAME